MAISDNTPYIPDIIGWTLQALMTESVALPPVTAGERHGNYQEAAQGHCAARYRARGERPSRPESKRSQS
jgi:hypothetical protein